MRIIPLLIYFFGYFIVTVSLVPLIRSDNWIFRIFEYPRAQKLGINLLLLVLALAVIGVDDTHGMIFAGLLTLNLLYLFYQVYPYTVLARHQMKGQKVAEDGKHFRLLVGNVYQYNRDVAACLRVIGANDPDIVLLVETDHWWKSALESLEEKYPHQVLRPIDNTYGMVLYSRLELIEPRVGFLVEEGVPSIHTRVKLPSGDIFFLHCVHPEPPVPQENPRSTERDAELLLVAKEAKACKIPVVVAGDLNDVAWSYTTELFMKVSGLLDPRRGRGFFSTFHARHWFFRWPLDHVFCSDHFHLIDIRRLPPIGSDHFPILVELALNYKRAAENKEEKLESDERDEEIAEEKIDKAV